jgi:hypothetical protein
LQEKHRHRDERFCAFKLHYIQPRIAPDKQQKTMRFHISAASKISSRIAGKYLSNPFIQHSALNPEHPTFLPFIAHFLSPFLRVSKQFGERLK